MGSVDGRRASAIPNGTGSDEMPRPDEVTQEMIDRWEEGLKELPPDIPPEIMRMPKIKETCYAGNWLGDKLRKAGAGEDDIESICFAAGQKMLFSDPWDVAQEELRVFESGEENDTPGPVLAERLCLEYLEEKGVEKSGS